MAPLGKAERASGSEQVVLASRGNVTDHFEQMRSHRVDSVVPGNCGVLRRHVKLRKSGFRALHHGNRDDAVEG